MTLLAWIILFPLLGGVLSVLAAALFLLLPESQRTRVLPAMVSFAIGALLGAAFLAVLPHALAAPGVRDMHAITGTVQLGVVAALAVAAHEIPQEVGDFAILLHSGFTRSKALFYNVLASLTTVLGGVLAYFSLGVVQAAPPYVLAVAASSFIYIAVADLIPGLHKRLEPRVTLEQVLLIGAGVLTIYFAHAALH